MKMTRNRRINCLRRRRAGSIIRNPNTGAMNGQLARNSASLAPELVCTVRIEVPLVLEAAARLGTSVLVAPSVTGLGENVAVAPMGKPVTERVTLPL